VLASLDHSSGAKGIYSYMSHRYAVLSQDYTVVNRLWDLCQNSGRDLPMYRTRITSSEISWVIELDDSAWSTRILLEHSGSLTCID
jgi:hypothetical protein